MQGFDELSPNGFLGTDPRSESNPHSRTRIDPNGYETTITKNFHGSLRSPGGFGLSP